MHYLYVYPNAEYADLCILNADDMLIYSIEMIYVY